MLRSRKAQSTLECAILILVLIMGLVAMQVYMQKAVHGRIKESTDRLGRQFIPGGNYSFARTEASSVLAESRQQRDPATGTITDTIINSVETVTRDEHENWGMPPADHTLP